MKLATSFLLFAAGANAFAPSSKLGYVTKLSMSDASAEPKSAGLEALEALAPQLNPIVPFWDPLNLVEGDFYNMGQDATIGFLRHAEIKHGRVAMAAFVGYCVQSNWHWPWAMMQDGTSFPSIDLSPEAQWDAVPVGAKWQIALVIALMEIWDEGSGGSAWDDEEGGMPHYTKGRQPGKYPSYQAFRDNIHFTLDLYDPFGLNKGMTAEVKERRLVAEINNGRLAMFGILGCLAADKIEGAVPALNNFAQPYAGQVMSPFEGQLNVFENTVGTLTSVAALGIIVGSRFRNVEEVEEVVEEPVVVLEVAAPVVEAPVEAAEAEAPAAEKEAKAPAAKAEAPAKEAKAPAAKAEAPAKEAKAPAAKAEAPAKEAKAPAAKAEAPAKEAKSPAAKTEAPAKEAEAPAAKAEAPTEEVKAPGIQKEAEL